MPLVHFLSTVPNRSNQASNHIIILRLNTEVQPDIKRHPVRTCLQNGRRLIQSREYLFDLNMVSIFKQDDLVWVCGTVKRPGKVLPPVGPNTNASEPQQYVYFFGSHDYECVKESELIPHSEEMMQQAETMPKDTILQLALQELKLEIAKQKVEEDSLSRPLEESPVASKLSPEPSGSKSNLQVNAVSKKLRSRGKKRRSSRSSQNDYSSQSSTSINTLKFKDSNQEERRDPEEVTEKKREKFENIDKDNLNTDQDNSYPFSNNVMLSDDDIRNVSETLPRKIFSSPPIPSKSCAGTSLLKVPSPTNQLDKKNDQGASGNTSTTSQRSTIDSDETSLDKQSCANLLHNKNDQTVIDSTASKSRDGSHDSVELDPSLNKSQPPNLLLEVSESPAVPKNLQTKAKPSNDNHISTDSSDPSLFEEQASSSLGIPPGCEVVVEDLGNLSDGDSSVLSNEGSDESLVKQQIRDVVQTLHSYNERGPESSRATTKEIGFLGIGKMGSVIVRNLLNSGHFITVWNRSPEKYQHFLDDGAEKADSPCEVIKRCDITFCCLSDEDAVKEVVEGENGVLEGFNRCRNNKTGKGFVQMTTLHPSISVKHSKLISELGGQYLEVAMIGSEKLAQELKLQVICAGNIFLFKDCYTCFASISHKATFSSLDVGKAGKMKIISSMMSSQANNALQRAMSQISQKKIPMGAFLDFLGQKHLGYLKNRAIALLNNEPDDELKSRQRDLLIADALKNTSNPIAASAQECDKKKKK